MTQTLSHRLASAAMVALLALPAAALANSSTTPPSVGAKPAVAQSSPLADHQMSGKSAEERVE